VLLLPINRPYSVLDARIWISFNIIYNLCKRRDHAHGVVKIGIWNRLPKDVVRFSTTVSFTIKFG